MSKIIEMKTLSLVWLITALLLIGQTATARTDEEIAAAKAFSIDGVHLGMSKANFAQLFPNAKKLDELTDATTSTLGFRVDSTSKTDGIDAEFWNESLLMMNVWYFVERTEKMGGYMTLIHRLVKLFGKADSNSEGATSEKIQLEWNIGEANFFCKIVVVPKSVRINITDIKALKERKAKMAEKADPGF